MTTAAVAAPHHRSAAAAEEILRGGGNAVDAAIAAVAVQGVVAPETCGIGGDLFALVHAPGWERPRALNASGRSGSNASADVLRADEAALVPRDHPLTVTIPGCVDGLVALADDLGQLPLGESLAPAIAAAIGGFEVSNEQARAFAAMEEVYRNNPAVAEFYPGGDPVSPGQTVHRANLAATLEALAEHGRDAFYSGRPGEDIVEAVGGVITMEDLSLGHSEWVDPIGVEVSGLTAWTTPPNSQGYLGPGALAVFEMVDPPDDPSDPLWWHLLIESYRSLAWERNDVVSDPKSLALPAELFLDRARLERAARLISPERAGVWPARVGTRSGTAYLCVADISGMAVSMIQSNYRGTGSPFGAARSGFLLQDRGGGFTLTSGHPNELAPGKRPLHTLSPTLWTRSGRARWLIGTRGGSVQPQLIAQVAARSVLGEQSLADAIKTPRWTISDFGPGTQSRLAVEPGVTRTVLDDLGHRGHQVTELQQPQPGWGPISIIELGDDGTRAAADPRVDTATAILL